MSLPEISPAAASRASASGPADRSDALHLHVYEERSSLSERRMRLATLLTAAAMLAEIVTGWRAHSMALLADGWHMSTHLLALGLAAAAYALARRLARDARFAFGTWKIEVLAGYTSALALGAVAVVMLYESAAHLLHPQAIDFGEALPVATIGLAVNLLCAVLLGGAAAHGAAHAHAAAEAHAATHPHGQAQAHAHAHAHPHAPRHEHQDGDDQPHAQSHHDPRYQDLNLRSAYVHVAADCATSLLAIVALLAARLLGLLRLDGLVGMIGALVVAVWALGLLRDASRVLLDAEMDTPLIGRIRSTVGALPVPAQIRDLHVWRVSRSKFACLLSVATEDESGVEQFHQALAGHAELAHLTVEVRREPAAAGAGGDCRQGT